MRVRPRGSRDVRELTVGAVVNCSGPSGDTRRLRDPLFDRLRLQGLVRPDPLGLGIDVGSHGALIDNDGFESPLLYYVGPFLRARDWEATAVPELRQYARRMADHLLDSPDTARRRQRRFTSRTASATDDHLPSSLDLAPLTQPRHQSLHATPHQPLVGSRLASREAAAPGRVVTSTGPSDPARTLGLTFTEEAVHGSVRRGDVDGARFNRCVHEFCARQFSDDAGRLRASAIPLKIVPVHVPLAVIPVTSAPVIERVHAQPSPHVHAASMARMEAYQPEFNQEPAPHNPTSHRVRHRRPRKAPSSISTPPAPPSSKSSPASVPPPPRALSNTARRTAASRRSKTS